MRLATALTVTKTFQQVDRPAADSIHRDAETPYDLNMVAEHLQPIHKASAYAEGAKNLAALTQHTSPQIDAVAEDIEVEVEERMGEDAKKQKVSIEGGTILERLDIFEEARRFRSEVGAH